MKGAEGDTGYFEIAVVFKGKPMDPMDDST